MKDIKIEMNNGNIIDNNNIFNRDNDKINELEKK